MKLIFCRDGDFFGTSERVCRIQRECGIRLKGGFFLTLVISDVKIDVGSKPRWRTMAVPSRRRFNRKLWYALYTYILYFRRVWPPRICFAARIGSLASDGHAHAHALTIVFARSHSDLHASRSVAGRPSCPKDGSKGPLARGTAAASRARERNAREKRRSALRP